MRLGRGLFAKTFVIAVMILLIFTFVGFALNGLVMRQWIDSTRLRPPGDPGVGLGSPWERDIFGGPPSSGFRDGMPLEHPSVMTARIIGALASKDRVEVLREIGRTDARSGARYILIDDSGNALYPPEEKLPFDWKGFALPEDEYDFKPLDSKDPSPARTLIRLPGRPVQYLYVELKRLSPLSPKVPLFMFGSHILAILLGAWVSLMILFRYLRRKMVLVDGVLEDLRGGNLEARLPSGGPDEFGGTTDRFNRMIDEIERLVGHLREVESSRMLLMQELAHDLRTPVASLKNLLETLRRKDETMGRTLRLELLDLAVNETGYFERLVEDLLMLAQINEPNYKASRGEVRLNDFLSETADLSVAPVVSEGHPIRLERDFPKEAVVVHGDTHLLRRMMRNALDNAYGSAKTWVRLSLRREATGEVRIRVEDDGPGFQPEMISLFGEKRIGQSRSRSKDGVLRAGLGAVIMKNIARIHGGAVLVGNRMDDSGAVLGAWVEIVLPG